MESYLAFGHYDLVTPDGVIAEILEKSEDRLVALISIQQISPSFVGFRIDPANVEFNVKSTLAQLGINGEGQEYLIDEKEKTAVVRVLFTPIGPLGKQLLSHLEVGCFVGKLFAADPSRRVRDPDYLLRMFGRYDRDDLPLLSLGGKHGSEGLHLEKIGEKTVAFLTLKNGIVRYDEEMKSFIPTLATALKFPKYKTRELLPLHQVWHEGERKTLHEDDILLVKTFPLHVRTVFARVAQEFLPEGVHHTTASVLQPDTKASGDIYELYGHTGKELTHIPLEFYTLEPHREHVFFSDRDQLQSSLDDPKSIFKAFETAPQDASLRTAAFVVKGEQMLKLKKEDWISRTIQKDTFPGLFDLDRQAQMVHDYIRMQPSYPFLKAIESGQITSQGVLFCRYFPSPLMKKMLLGDLVQKCLKGIYFEEPSQSHGRFFSHEDRATLIDLARFAIPVYWADKSCGKILQFAVKPEKDTGMFVPIAEVDTFTHSTVFGVYGSTLVQIEFEEELEKIMAGVLDIQKSSNHAMLNADTPLSLVTGGGPGVMASGNRVARNLGILSCANIVDLRGESQEQNPYIDAKMTYRLDKLVERQAEFNLDFPIFLVGGIGTDFEFALEQVRRKVGSGPPTPVLLLGPTDYWRDKITPHFQRNLKSGLIKGYEWVSNCFYAVEKADAALKIYEEYFSGKLPIGKDAPSADDGFIPVS
jgi:predicted Rossmann-fold nucleotide-binding protein